MSCTTMTKTCEQCGTSFEVNVYDDFQRVCGSCEAHADSYHEERIDQERDRVDNMFVDLEPK